VDVPWAQAFEEPGSAGAVVTLEPGSYAFVCLSVAGPTRQALLASGAFDVSE
jgi:hypothetical protein